MHNTGPIPSKEMIIGSLGLTITTAITPHNSLNYNPPLSRSDPGTTS